MNDCLSKVFNYLPLKDLLNCFPACKQFNDIINNDFFWKSLLESDFNYCSLDYCKDIYRQCYKLDKWFIKETSQTDKPTNLKQIMMSNELNLCRLWDTSKIINGTRKEVYNHGIALELPKEISILTNLKKLSLCNNNLESVQHEICLLTNLQKLNLSENKLLYLPTKISQLTNLQELDLNCNLLEYIRPETWALTNLEILGLEDNKLTNIPSEISLLTNLKDIDIGWNKIEYLPNELALCTKLQVLSIGVNPKLKSLPENLNLLTNLSQIWIDGRRIQYTIPPDLHHLVRI